MAAQPEVSIDNVSTDIASGATTTVQYTVTRSSTSDATTALQIAVAVKGNGMTCASDCTGAVNPKPGASVTRTTQLKAPQVAAGQTRSITIQITAGFDTVGADTFTASQPLTVRGADKVQTVRQISGKVKDGTGKPIAGAAVGIRDSTNRYYETVSNADGGYAFTASDTNPIGVGSITVGAAKDGFKAATVTVQGGADKSINVPLTMPSLTASASPSASVSTTAPPSEEATTDAATDGPTTAVTPTNNAAGTDKGSNSTLFVVLGGLLVAAGIGAFVLVLMRRKNNDDPDDPDDPDGGPGPTGVVPPSQGRFNTPDRTRIGAPVGANDQTMVANLAEAPTMMHRAVPQVDEFPDPYGAPAVSPGSYAGPGGWGTTSAAASAPVVPRPVVPRPVVPRPVVPQQVLPQQVLPQQGGGTYGGSQYGGGAGNQYGGAAAIPAQSTPAYDGAGYGVPAGQYGRPQQAEDAYGAYGPGQYGGGGAEPQRFDEPTGLYRPEPSGYQAGGYDQGGHEATRGYGQSAPPQQGGNRESGSYGSPGGGIYGQPAQQDGGYPPAGGYQGGGYGGGQQPADDQGGYGQWNGSAAGAGGYEPSASGGYDQRGGYGAAAPAPAYPDQGGYDQRGGYGGGYQEPQQGRGNAPQGGAPSYGQLEPYDGGTERPPEGGRHGGQRQQPQLQLPSASPPESTHPGQRRSLDWLDD